MLDDNVGSIIKFHWDTNQCSYNVFNYINHLFCACSMLTLNPFLCFVLWLVTVFVNAPIGLVYACFAVDVVALPLFWTTHKSQTKYFDTLRVMHVI